MIAEQNHKHLTVSEVTAELKKITEIGFPLLAMGFVGYIRNLILVVCMGRLGSLDLAAGALAIGFTNITGYSVLSGMAMGMEPLCSQAFGSSNLNIVSLTLQRTIILLLSVSLPIGLLWLNLEPLMLWLHQDPAITQIASTYCRYAVPDLVANSLLHPLRIYLRSKGTTWPLLWCNSLAILLHLPIITFLTFTFGLGVQGVAISNFITNFNVLFLLLGYMFFSQMPKEPSCKPLVTTAAELPSTTSLGEEWGTLLRFAISSCLAVCLEWWWYEFMTLLAGYLQSPHIALATSAIVIQTTSLMYTMPSALSASISTRVGNELGSGRPSKARLATVVAIGLALLTSVFGLLWTILGGEAWAKVFTKDSEVLALTMAVLPIIGLCELANCPQTTCCGVLRGSARPSIGVAINFYSFYLVGAPVALALAFFWKLEFMGLCYGLLAAQVACALSILTAIYQTDWEKESMKAKELVGGSSELAYDDQIMKCDNEIGSCKEVAMQENVC